MKRFVTAIALACALSGVAFAGDVPSVGITSTPPVGTQPPTTTPGEIPTGGLSYEVADTAIDLIQMLISVV